MADRRLQVFETVARLLSFTKAAELLNMTQPAVTFQIRQLEEHFNTRLFEREHGRVTLTEAGRHALQYAEKILALYEEMDQCVNEMVVSIGGELIIGASTTIAEYMLPPLLGQFKSKHPDIILSLKVSNSEAIIAMVEQKEVDLAIVEIPVVNKNLEIEICLEDKLVAVVPPGHPLSRRATVRPKEFAKYPFIAREKGSGTRDVIIEYLIQEGANNEGLNICLELGSPEAIKGAVEAGIGISVLSDTTVAKEKALGTLHSIPLDPPLRRPFSFIRQQQRFHHRALEELLEFARNYCRQHA